MKQPRLGEERVPPLVAALYLALILPPEFSVQLGSLRLTAYRLLLLVTVPWLLIRLFSAARPPHAADWLLIAHAAWVVLALCIYAGPLGGIESGGIYVVECLGAYLVGRLAITDAASHRATLRFMVAVLAGMALFTIPESLTGAHLIRDAARAIMGGPGLPVIDPRLGLERAFGSFDHPILYGVFAASTFAAAHYVLNEERLAARHLAVLALIGGSCFISLSAGPYVGMGCQALVLGWDRLTRGFAYRWTALMAVFAMFWTALSLGSNRSPVKVLISYLSFSPESSYNRILIWEYGSAEVARHPLFGIGFGDWVRAPWMSDSMDNFWLVTAVRYGLPALLLLIAAIVTLALGQAAATRHDLRLNRHRMAWVAIIVGMAVSGTTVHFWNSLFTYFFFLLGSGAWLLDPHLPGTRQRWLLITPAPQLARDRASLPPAVRPPHSQPI